MLGSVMFAHSPLTLPESFWVMSNEAWRWRCLKCAKMETIKRK